MTRARDLADRNFADNDKVVLGSGDDLEISHNATNSIIENKTGYLALRSQDGGQIRIEDTSGNASALFNDNADVKLRYASSDRLVTTSAGVDVSGSATLSSSLSGEFNALTISQANNTSGNESRIRFKRTTDAGTDREVAAIVADRVGGNDTALVFETNSDGSDGAAERVRIEHNGNVGIGVSPENLLHIKGSSNGQKILHLDNSAGSSHGDTSNKIRVTSGNNGLWAELKAEAHSFDFQIQGGVTGGILDSDAILKLKSANNIGRIMTRSSVSIADDSSVTLTNATAGAVIAMIYDTSSGSGASVFFSYQGSPEIIKQSASAFVIGDTDSKFCIIKSANSHTATFKNRSGVARSFHIFLIGGDVRP